MESSHCFNAPLLHIRTYECAAAIYRRKMFMKKDFLVIVLGVMAFFTSGAANAGQRPAVEMWRLDCGTIEIGNLNDYSDSFMYPGRSMTLTDSCYLIRSGDRYLL